MLKENSPRLTKSPHAQRSFFKGIDLNELPSLIYQLILLATKGATDVKASLLRGIANHLENEGRKYDEEYVFRPKLPP